MPKHNLRCLILGLCLIPLVPAVATATATFGFSDVAQIAKELAQKPYEAPSTIPQFLINLEYDEYRKIRFQPENSLWRPTHTNFQVMLVSPGLLYRHPVQINVVNASGVKIVPFHKDWFSWPDDLKSKVPGDLGYAGFKLTFPLNAPDQHSQFLVFAGASYFRGIARHQRFGLSARGIAINTGLASGEEFPDFTRFWLVRPSPDAKAMKFYALLEGPSLTGAYRFVVYPGAPTRLEVRVRLFVRQPIKMLGLAPLTSMFYYGENTPRPEGALHAAVHDSDGLLIHSGSGEWLWRPLVNPGRLQVDYFTANSPKGFGLLQRDTRFSDYKDAHVRYDKRPSAWVEPDGDWGKGHVVLVEIPTNSETNDNIVAFWSPSEEPSPGEAMDFSYTLLFGRPDIPGEPMAHVTSTLVGRAAAAGDEDAPDDAYRILVDFTGGHLDELDPDAKVTAVVTGLDGTQVLGQTVMTIDSPELRRLSMLVKPADGNSVRLRAFLKHGDETLSETWSYALPPHNRFVHDE